MDALDIAIAEQSQQRSKNWHDVRLGRFTASEFWKLMGTPRGKTEDHLTDTGISYVNEKVAEIVTGQQKIVTSWAIEWGSDQEFNAIKEYEARNRYKVSRAGFVSFGEHAGGTTDGYMPDQFIEVKCPYNSDHHIEFLQCETAQDLKDMEPKYFWQIQANLLFNASKGINEAVFISFDPRVLKAELQLHSFIIEPDKDAFELIGIKLGAAIKLKQEILTKIKYN